MPDRFVTLCRRRALIAALLVALTVLPALGQAKTKTVGSVTITRRPDGLLVKIATGRPARPVTMATLRPTPESWGQGTILVAEASLNDMSGALDSMSRGGKPGWHGSAGSTADHKMGLTYYTLPGDMAEIVLFDERQSLRQVNSHEFTVDPSRTPALAAVTLTKAQAKALLDAFYKIR